MAEPALRTMTRDEFACRNDGTDARYEPVGGFPVTMATMAPMAVAPGVLAARIFVADIGAGGAPCGPGRQAVRDSSPIVEVLSPGMERHDRRLKPPFHHQIEPVQGVLTVDPAARHGEVHRLQAGQWIGELLRNPEDAVIPTSIGTSFALSDLYGGLVFDDALAG